VKHVVAVLLLLASGVTQQEPTISLVALIANPERYDHKRVVVSGFMYLQREYNALYIGKADFQHGQFKNSVYLLVANDMSERIYRLNGCYVIASGTFDAKNTGHLGLFSGALTVAQVMPTSTFTIPSDARDATDAPRCK
jgi:hypothetical protein